MDALQASPGIGRNARGQGAQGPQKGGDANRSDAIGGQFDGAIAKLEGAPKKAQKKIPPGTVDNLRQEKANTVQQNQQAEQAEADADATMSDLGMGDARKDGGKGFVQEKTSTIRSQGGGQLTGNSKLDQMLQSTDNILKGKPQQFNESAQFKGGDVVSPGSTNDLGKLNKSLGQQMQQGSQMQSDFGRLGGIQSQEAQRNATMGKQVKGLGALKNAFGAKEKAHAGKEKAFNGAGQALGSASQG